MSSYCIIQGKQLIKIEKWFPSTKTCSACGNNMDRDYNATRNIKKEGIRLVALYK